MYEQKHSPAAIKEAITATVLVIIAAVLGSMVPFVGLLIYFTAIPFFIVTRKHGFLFVLPFAFMAYFFIGVYSSFIGAIFDVLATVMPAVLMGELSRLNRNQSEVLGKGIITSILFNVGAFAAQYFVSGKPMVDTMRAIIEEPLGKAVQSGETTLHMAQMARDSYEMMLKAVPAIVFLWSAIIILVIYFVGCNSLIKRGTIIEKYRPFRLFTFSRNLIFGALLIYALAFFVGSAGVVDGQALNINLMIIGWFLFALQGTAVLTFFCMKMRIPKALFALMIFILFISVLGTIALFVLGLIDLVVNFRMRSTEDKG